MKKANDLDATLYIADQWYRVEEIDSGTIYRQYFQIYVKDDLWFKRLVTDLPGNYQKKNIATVLRTIDVLRDLGFEVTDESILSGCRKVKTLTGLRGRWEILGTDPLVICDTGHNKDGLREVVRQIKRTPHRKLHFIFGTVNDKDPGPVLEILPKDARYYFTQASIPRAMIKEELAVLASKAGLRGGVYSTPVKALEAAKNAAKKDDLIFVGGSTFVVGEVL
jgi:dihydrofolate synthase/folylpolyglutamate synthase